ncbi:MAG TPA: phosphatase PAP2 family protein [Mycobacteriales bacterium]|nr:phosphatase PAP2 family protein [Mycobacteriales bacterium]
MTPEGVDLALSKESPADDTLLIVRTPPAGPVTQPQRLGWYARLQGHRRTWMAIRGFREILLVAGVYSLYDATRYLVAGKSSEAFENGHSLLRVEKDVGLAPEHWLNKLFSAHLALGLPADYVYATLHYIVTPVVLVWLWRRHGSAYSHARSVLMVATIIGLVGFSLLPVAPPRLLPEFVDTMAKFSHYGWWSNAASAPRGLGADTNQYAALPSLHVGWALWCGWQLVRYGRHRITQVLGALYPILLSVVVMATANHYLIDVLAGVVAVALAYGIVRLLTMAGLVLPPGGTSPGVPAGPEPATT